MATKKKEPATLEEQIAELQKKVEELLENDKKIVAAMDTLRTRNHLR
jgi:hypothetical protein